MTDQQLIPVPQKIISEVDKKNALQSAIYYLSNQQPFYGSLLQELTVKYTTMLPTAAISYNPKMQQYEIFINPNFFCEQLTNEQRVAVFHHEVLHFTNKHLFRLPFMDAKEEDRKLYNIAGDMAINQFIKDLPPGCVDVKEWKLDDGNLFPTFQTMEQYYELIKKESQKQQKNKNTKGNVNDKLAGYKEFDQHMWDQLDEETKKQMLEEARKLLKRTIEKTSFSHSNVPDSIKDLLQEIDHMAAGINYKQILKNVIKKTVSCADRESTWKKSNKRYGVYSPGTKLGALPNLNIYIDTSGSISVKEMNSFLHIMSEFLKVGTRNCNLGLWHTNLYHKQKYRLHNEINKENVESGGTDVTCVMEHIKKSKPDLSIVLTDLYFSAPEVVPSTEVLWIVSEGGNKDRSHINPKQKVIYLDKLK